MEKLHIVVSTKPRAFSEIMDVETSILLYYSNRNSNNLLSFLQLILLTLTLRFTVLDYVVSSFYQKYIPLIHLLGDYLSFKVLSRNDL